MSEIALLADLDAVCVTAGQLEQLGHTTTRRHTSPERTRKPVFLRAHQTQFPTGLLQEDGYFLKRVSGESKIIKCVLARELGRMVHAMEVIEQHLVKEVREQLEDCEIQMRPVLGENSGQDGGGRPQRGGKEEHHGIPPTPTRYSCRSSDSRSGTGIETVAQESGGSNSGREKDLLLSPSLMVGRWENQVPNLQPSLANLFRMRPVIPHETFVHAEAATDEVF